MYFYEYVDELELAEDRVKIRLYYVRELVN
jgi:hypothetical protein